eukprot:4232739-Pyramimonas_sp.AAC.1
MGNDSESKCPVGFDRTERPPKFDLHRRRAMRVYDEYSRLLLEPVDVARGSWSLLSMDEPSQDLSLDIRAV